MSETTATNSSSNGGFFGHPWGLSTLFFTEMWERLSYYGMRAILVLYMTAELAKGGLGMDAKTAAAIYGLYTASVYFLPLIGGWIADRFIGAKRATLIGGIIIAIGHFLLAFPPLTFFYAGLIFVAVGTGFLKANISKMVGDLYSAEDARRDAGFSIFYMGINIGAFLAPFICGGLAAYDWHWGFAAAGVGMLLGLIQYVVGYRNLEGVGEVPKSVEGAQNDFSVVYLFQIGLLIAATIAVVYFFDTPIMPTLLVAGLIAVLMTGMQDGLSFDDWKRLGAILILFTFSMIFWMGFEQAGSSLTLFAEQMTERTVFGYEFPSSWLQAVNPIMIILLAPFFAWLWVKFGQNAPSDALKFVFGLFFAGLGFVILAYASTFTGAGKVTWWWLVAVYLCHTIGELCLSPVGLSSMTKLAPLKMVGLMMGVWFLSISMGSYLAGIVAGEFEAKPEVLVGMFSNVAIVTIVGAGILLLVVPIFNKLARKAD